MINKCPSCGKTAIGPIKKCFTETKRVFKCKECGAELKLSSKWNSRILVFLIFAIICGVNVWFPGLDIVKHTFFSTLWFQLLSVIIIGVAYMFIYIWFVPVEYFGG
jgi:uncharacterized protein (DUF983 family)